jgi:hypothetical protein
MRRDGAAAGGLMSAAVLRLDGARGGRVRCTAGTAWLTEDGSARDVVLAPGDEHVVQGDGPVLVVGLPACGLLLWRQTGSAPEAVQLG